MKVNITPTEALRILDSVMQYKKNFMKTAAAIRTLRSIHRKMKHIINSEN